jgi:hypothetical protein
MADVQKCLHCNQPLSDEMVCRTEKCYLEGHDQSDPSDFDTLQQYRRQRIIEDAVRAADRILMDGSNGSVEETDWLTTMFANKYSEKVLYAANARLMRAEFEAKFRVAKEEAPVEPAMVDAK